MRAILLMAALVACGDDPAHDEVDCPFTWGPVTNQRCERACEAGPACAPTDSACISAQPPCKVRDASTGFPNCQPQLIASFEGQRGCCEDASGPDAVIRFTACEGE